MFQYIVVFVASICIVVVVVLHDYDIIHKQAMIMLLCIACSIMFAACKVAFLKLMCKLRNQTAPIAPRVETPPQEEKKPDANVGIKTTEVEILPSDHKVCIGRSSSSSMVIVINPSTIET